MKKFKFSFFAIMTIIANCMFVACGDDKDNPDNPEKPGSAKCVISEVAIIDEEDGDTGLFSNFKFDKDGRITNYKLQYSYDSEIFGDSYTYTSSVIRVTDQDNDVMATYTLENGLIVAAKDYWDNRWEYTYDSNKHITTIKAYDESSSEPIIYTCNWENGNLVSYNRKIDEGFERTYTVKYNDHENTLKIFPVDIFDGYLDCDDGRIFDAILCSQGYFGAMPSKLMSEILGNFDGGYSKGYKFNYADFNKYGYPAQMTTVYLNAEDNGETINDTYKFTWKM